jgi:chromosome partitioning protein
MIVTVASFKGGVGKTTTAVHLAAYLQMKAPAVLVDGDDNNSATAWAKRGSLPFPVVDARQTARVARQYEHLIIDTPARPSQEDLRDLVEGCDLLIIPSTPDALSLDALMLTVEALRSLGTNRFRILLTVIPPRPSRDGDEARAMLLEEKLPLFKSGVRRLAAFQKAALAGALVRDVADPRAIAGWEDYEAVGKEIIK